MTARHGVTGRRWSLARAELPAGWLARVWSIERQSRQEVADALGISYQAVEQAETSGLQKLAAMRGAFAEYL